MGRPTALLAVAAVLLAIPGAGAATADLYIIGGSDSEPYIVGGIEAGQEEFPFMVRLLMFPAASAPYGFVCGGTLVRADWVLTAAHCLDAGPYNAIYAFVGTNDDFIPYYPTLAGYGGTFVRGHEAAGVFVHPLWSGSSFNHDVALLRLRESAVTAAIADGTDFVPQVARINGATSPLLKGGSYTPVLGHDVTAVGWGRTSTESGDQAATLQELTTPLRSCDPWSFVATTILCAGTTEPGLEQTTCNGDSGGPLLRDVDPSEAVAWVQIGITSFGPANCSHPDDPPAAYTRVTQMMTFIQGVLAAHAGLATLKVTPTMAAPYAATGFRVAAADGAPIAECVFVPGDLADCTGAVEVVSSNQVNLAPGKVVVSAFALAADGTEVAASAQRALTLSGGRSASTSLALRPLAGDGTPGSGFALVRLEPTAPFATRIAATLTLDGGEPETCLLDRVARTVDCSAAPSVLELAYPYVAVPAPAALAWSVTGQVEDTAAPDTWDDASATAQTPRTLAVRAGATVQVRPSLAPLGTVVRLDATGMPYAPFAAFDITSALPGDAVACLADTAARTMSCQGTGNATATVLAYPYVRLDGLAGPVKATGQAFVDEAQEDAIGPATNPATLRLNPGRSVPYAPRPTIAGDAALLKVTLRPAAVQDATLTLTLSGTATSWSCTLDVAAKTASSCSDGLTPLVGGHLRLTGQPTGARFDETVQDNASSLQATLLARPIPNGRVTAVTFTLR